LYYHENPRRLWQAVNELLRRINVHHPYFPLHHLLLLLKVLLFFTDKVDKLRLSLAAISSVLCPHTPSPSVTQTQFSAFKPATMVHTDPGKVWKVLEFNVQIFKALKSLENDHRYGKVWKNS